jgi:hypothetical protein
MGKLKPTNAPIKASKQSLMQPKTLPKGIIWETKRTKPLPKLTPKIPDVTYPGPGKSRRVFLGMVLGRLREWFGEAFVCFWEGFGWFSEAQWRFGY